jgi:uncharacterized protein (TIGR00255 family)
MTGFAAARGQIGGTSAGQGAAWAWELRSVNGRGLDLRLRLPETIAGLETGVRALISAAVARGSVTLSLRIDRAAGAGVPRVDAAALGAMLDAVAQVQAAATARGVALAPVSATDLLGLRGVLDTGAPEPDDDGALAAALLADLPALIADFESMRLREGAALAALIRGQLDRVGALVAEAETALAPRAERLRTSLAEAVARISDAAPHADSARLEQELALLATKSDITEELDRLRAHVDAARALLAQGGPVGRKLDFLMQEFNREANTLCAKSQSAALTRIGLDLKAVIDQMREQVQNVE